jgi:hypothetical protein
VNNILRKENALEFDEDKVDKLLKVLHDCLGGFLGNCVVFAGSERAGEALRQNKSATEFKRSGNWFSSTAIPEL